MTNADAPDHAHGHAHAHGQHGNHGPSAELAGIVALFGDARGAAVDIGCGTGADAVYLAECGFDVTGIDVSATALAAGAERAARHGVRVNWVEGSALDLPFDDGSLVAAFDRGCLHHIAVEDHPRYVAEIARVLAPGGRVFLRDISGHGHHPTPVTPTGIVELVRDLPLAVVSTVPFQMGGNAATLAVLVRA